MRSTAQYPRRSFLTGALALAGAGYGRAEEPKAEIPVYNRMTDDEEIALGREAAKGIEKERQLRFIEDPRIVDYTTALFQKIVKSSRRPNLPYSIKIVDTGEINAFALPGGFVYLNRGLMSWSRNEAELVSPLSHEIGHVVGRHAANSASRMSMADSLLSEASRVLFGDDTPARILKQVGGPVAFLALMKFSRAQEFEADLLGFYNLQRAGWSPTGMVQLFEHFGEQSSVLDPLLTIGSTHPAALDRKEQITTEMKQFPTRPGLTLDSDGFKAMQAALKALPAPTVVNKLVG